MATRGLLNVVGSFIHHDKDNNDGLTCMGRDVWIGIFTNFGSFEGDI